MFDMTGITMKKSLFLNRRSFLRSASVGVASPLVVPSSVFGKTAASNRITIGVIGLGGRGMGVMKSFLGQPDVQVVALCDVQRSHWRDGEWGAGPARFGSVAAEGIVKAHYARGKPSGDYRGCELYQDYRNLCAREDIDAVIVATPDHWHALQALEVLRSGKDVYCEKPMTHLFREGQMIYREAAERNAIFQVGSQQRSTANFHQAVELVLNGVIGKVKRVEVGLPGGHLEALGDDQVQKAPANLDYDSWCGPSPLHPYVPARHHRNWRWHLSYGGGQLMDWIGHHNDIAHWGLGMDRGGPVEVEAVNWTWPRTKVYNAPVDFDVISKYAGGLEIRISSRNPMGTKWIGDDGWVFVNRGKISASKKEWLAKDFSPGGVRACKSADHTRNFIDGVKARRECICPAETGHRSITPGHLAHISAVVGRKLKWNPETETIIGDQGAEDLLNIDYRYPWRLG